MAAGEEADRGEADHLALAADDAGDVLLEQTDRLGGVESVAGFDGFDGDGFHRGLYTELDGRSVELAVCVNRLKRIPGGDYRRDYYEGDYRERSLRSPPSSQNARKPGQISGRFDRRITVF